MDLYFRVPQHIPDSPYPQASSEGIMLHLQWNGKDWIPVQWNPKKLPPAWKQLVTVTPKYPHDRLAAAMDLCPAGSTLIGKKGEESLRGVVHFEEAPMEKGTGTEFGNDKLNDRITVGLPQ